MISISLTDFVDFVSTSGTTRLTKVRALVERGDYHPCKDYYKRLRDVITEMHSAAQNREPVDMLLGSVRDESKQAHFAEVARGHHRWHHGLRSRGAAWFDPPAGEWTHRNLAITVNPELGFTIDGKRHVIKMYFKAEPLAPREAHVINRLMSESFEADGATFAVLDTRRGTLIRGVGRARNLHALLEGEAEAFITMHELLAA